MPSYLLEWRRVKASPLSVSCLLGTCRTEMSCKKNRHQLPTRLAKVLLLLLSACCLRSLIIAFTALSSFSSPRWDAFSNDCRLTSSPSLQHSVYEILPLSSLCFLMRELSFGIPIILLIQMTTYSKRRLGICRGKSVGPESKCSRDTYQIGTPPSCKGAQDNRVFCRAIMSLRKAECPQKRRSQSALGIPRPKITRVQLVEILQPHWKDLMPCTMTATLLLLRFAFIVQSVLTECRPPRSAG